MLQKRQARVYKYLQWIANTSAQFEGQVFDPGNSFRFYMMDSN